MTFLYPLALLGLLGIPLWYLFFLFRQRRLKKIWPSLFLWEILESKISPIPQKNKKYWDPLLLLPFLAIAALSFGAAHLQYIRKVPKSRKIGIILDCTASMICYHSSGKRRFEKALEEVQSLLFDLSSQDQVFLFSFPSFLSSPSPPLSPQQAWEAINQLKPLELGEDFLGFFSTLKPLYPQIETWYFFTDHLPSLEDSSLHIISVGENIENGALRRLGIRQRDAYLELLASIQHWGNQKKKYSLEILWQQKKWQKEIWLSPNSIQKVFFHLPLGRGMVKAELKPKDSFDLDNQRSIFLDHPRQIPLFYDLEFQNPLFWALKASGRFRLISHHQEGKVYVGYSSSPPLPKIQIRLHKPFQKKIQIETFYFTQAFFEIFPAFPYKKIPLAYFPSSPLPGIPLLVDGKGRSILSLEKKGDQEIWHLAFSLNKDQNPWLYHPSFPLLWEEWGKRMGAIFLSEETSFQTGKTYFLPFVEKIHEKGKRFFWKNHYFTPLDQGVYTGKEKDGQTRQWAAYFFNPKESNLRGQFKGYNPGSARKLAQKEEKPISLKFFFLWLAFFGILLYLFLDQRRFQT